jgi:hypothetical protein
VSYTPTPRGRSVLAMIHSGGQAMRIIRTYLDEKEVDVICLELADRQLAPLAVVVDYELMERLGLPEGWGFNVEME